MKLNQVLLAAMAVAALQGCAVADVPAPDPRANEQTDTIPPGGCAADRLKDHALVGKSEKEATGLLEGCTWRIGERDGEQFAGTMDYREERRTIGLADGKVIWVRRG